MARAEAPVTRRIALSPGQRGFTGKYQAGNYCSKTVPGPELSVENAKLVIFGHNINRLISNSNSAQIPGRLRFWECRAFSKGVAQIRAFSRGLHFAGQARSVLALIASEWQTVNAGLLVKPRGAPRPLWCRRSPLCVLSQKPGTKDGI